MWSRETPEIAVELMSLSSVTVSRRVHVKCECCGPSRDARLWIVGRKSVVRRSLLASLAMLSYVWAMPSYGHAKNNCQPQFDGQHRRHVQAVGETY